MAKEQFFYPETQPLFQKLEELSRRSGVSRGQGFEDWLTGMVCALAAETKEEEYLQMVERHKKGKPGQRGIDLIAQMFAELVHSMSHKDDDILGDLFQGAVTYGESGQYLSPASIAELLARLSVDSDARPARGESIYVHDCCCGTGRMLLAAANMNPHVELVGQDIDARCARITAINLGLRGEYGWVVCGNALTGDSQFAYRIGSFFHETPNGPRRGVIRDVLPEETPVPVIAERVRHDASALFTSTDDPQPAPQPTLPTIIEVPRWLARLEPQLTALDGDSADTEAPGRQVQPEPEKSQEQKLFEGE